MLLRSLVYRAVDRGQHGPQLIRVIFHRLALGKLPF
jgi:hypothetical protein